jgi:hypothetical protein
LKMIPSMVIIPQNTAGCLQDILFLLISSTEI